MTSPRAVPVLFEGEGYLAVDKPAGILVIPGRSEESGPCLQEILEAQRGQKLWVVHRLDRDTSGVLLFALNPEAHRTLSMAFEGGQMEKRYYALVKGRMEQPLDIEVPLLPARRGRMRPARAQEGGKPAHTLVSPVRVFPQASWVEAVPLTGRTHQIRVHLRWAGHPLLVDHQYGAKEPLRNGEVELLARTPLHAHALRIPQLPGISAREVSAPLPPDLQATLEWLQRT